MGENKYELGKLVTALRDDPRNKIKSWAQIANRLDTILQEATLNSYQKLKGELSSIMLELWGHVIENKGNLAKSRQCNASALKEILLINLADYADVMHQALEGRDLDFNDRLRYLGHLAMSARFFKAVILNEPIESIETYFGIEDSAFKMATPRDERGNIAKESWSEVSKVLAHFIQSQRDA